MGQGLLLTLEAQPNENPVELTSQVWVGFVGHRAMSPSSVRFRSVGGLNRKYLPNPNPSFNQAKNVTGIQPGSKKCSNINPEQRGWVGFGLEHILPPLV